MSKFDACTFKAATQLTGSIWKALGIPNVGIVQCVHTKRVKAYGVVIAQFNEAYFYFFGERVDYVSYASQPDVIALAQAINETYSFLS